MRDLSDQLASLTEQDEAVHIVKHYLQNGESEPSLDHSLQLLSKLENTFRCIATDLGHAVEQPHESHQASLSLTPSGSQNPDNFFGQPQDDEQSMSSTEWEVGERVDPQSKTQPPASNQDITAILAMLVHSIHKMRQDGEAKVKKIAADMSAFQQDYVDNLFRICKYSFDLILYCNNNPGATLDNVIKVGFHIP